MTGDTAAEAAVRLDGEVIENVETVELPDTLPVLPLRDAVLYPIMLMPAAVGREPSVRLVDECLAGDRFLVLATQKDATEESPGPEGVHAVGTAATMVRMSRAPDGTLRILVQGIRRVRLISFERTEPYLVARVESIEEENDSGPEVEVLRRNVLDLFRRIVTALAQVPPDVLPAVEAIESPGRLADFAASNLNIPLEKKQEILAAGDVEVRLRTLIEVLTRELEVIEIGSEIQQKVRSEMDKHGREAVLREQLKAIQDELGEGDAQSAELEELRERIEKAGLPEEARKAADHELGRLERMHPAAAEYNVSRSWLDWLASLPWDRETEDRLDVAAARAILDEDHYDLEKVKDRILEYLSVLKLKDDLRGPILCFAGPPGVGKTSLGRSIARAVGREFIRIALGGVRDEAEIRGHRRTYIGALPGRVIQAIRKAGTRNPLFMLDEIDKLGQDFRGDPSSALLEVLDPEQNSTFADHYLEVHFDLGKVMFITTANNLASIPPPLRDRMEVIELPGYTDREKIGIARRHLVPKQVREHGLPDDLVTWEDEAIRSIIRGHTREAGVRNLEREIAAILRKIARGVVEGNVDPVVVTPEKVRNLLGPERFFDEVAERTCTPGVATGLAWTAAGGDVLFIEATRMSGKKGLMVTGSIGDVMKESAQAALSLIRSRAEEIGIEPDFFDSCDLHLHVPAGAIPKDGPSAGVTMTVALASLLTGRPIRSDTAMTGEITLRGRVLPVGGIKEKVLAAHRAGIRRVILPERNGSDLEDVPEEIREEMEFHLVGEFGEAVTLALVPTGEDCLDAGEGKNA